MEKSSILWFKILFLDTTENAPLTLQGIIFILSRLNIFYPSFSQKKKKKKIRERKRWQAKRLLLFGGATILFDNLRRSTYQVGNVLQVES